MRPADNNIEEQIKNLKTEASAELDEKMHRKFQQALGKEKTTTASHQPIRWSIILHSRITKLAVAAALVLGVLRLTVVEIGVPEQTKINEAAARSETPAEMVSILSLNMAFRDGGMEAVEEQFEKAEKRVKSGLKENVTADELICELGGC